MALFDRLKHRIHGPSEVLSVIEAQAGTEAAHSVGDAIDKAKAAGVPWLAILKILLPIILAVVTGGAIDIPAIIAAIMALINNMQAPAPEPQA